MSDRKLRLLSATILTTLPLNVDVQPQFAANRFVLPQLPWACATALGVVRVRYIPGKINTLRSISPYLVTMVQAVCTLWRPKRTRQLQKTGDICEQRFITAT